jgi:RND family efflux transporter MFP subunit
MANTPFSLDKRLTLPLPILLIAALSLLMACERPQDTAEPPLPRLVRTLSVTAQGDNTWHEFPGQVEAARKADLSFRVAGELKKLLVKEGDLVKQRQLLALLDDTDFRIQLDRSQAQYDKTESDFQRAEKLFDRRAISNADYDSLKAQWESARASLAAARQNVAYTKLKAPFAGRIAVRHVENYEEVQAKQAIVTLQDPKTIMIRIDVPESVMIRVRESSEPEVYAVFRQIPDRKFPLTLKEVSTQSDEQTKTFSVNFIMPAVEGFNLLPGMSVTVHARPESPAVDGQKVIHVPAHAVLEDESGRFVYLAKSKGEGRGVVEKRLVSVGEMSTLGLAVINGLAEGDKVVTAGMSKMVPGLEVRLPLETGQ